MGYSIKEALRSVRVTAIMCGDEASPREAKSGKR